MSTTEKHSYEASVAHHSHNTPCLHCGKTSRHAVHRTWEEAKTNGYTLFEAPDYIVVATGFLVDSDNPKTGPMIQVWILPRHVNPVEAVKLGLNRIVCLDCKHAGTNGKDVTCYVRVANAPLAIWRAYHRGIYPLLPLADIPAVFQGRKVRFGAYGEPVLIPMPIFAAMADAAYGWTGYTHQWQVPAYSAYRAYLMASVDTIGEFLQAKEYGWRCFRVRSESMPLLQSEIICPAAPEGGHRTVCAECRLCNGAKPEDRRKDIAIVVHGAGKSKFELITIAGVA